VLLDVSVADEKGRPIRNLDRDQFKVYEDKIEQPISHFSQEESPVTWGLVLDRSASMSGRIRDVYEAAIHILGEGLKDDEMFIMTFNDGVELVARLTSNRRELQQLIVGLKAEGNTAMYDAIGAALEYIKQGQHRKKVLVLITDGMDNHSRVGFRSLRDRVRESDVLVYTVGMYDILESFQARKGALNTHELEEIAENTGGYAYFPTDMEKCRQTMNRIAEEVSAHYTIGYYPTNQMHDGGWRKTKVIVTPRDRITKPIARARSGYYADER
jgi:Ca-activated chloride channel family protein